ncbi:hypothetical protein [Brachybacterium alimentarium]|uniref:hypothetical protein n=1 Tax=Brachybacterium alimentarium TaxID=47845 RepID=UPI0015F02E35|nr:hypothetical protein [Brachybacterium alimentarium]
MKRSPQMAQVHPYQREARTVLGVLCVTFMGGASTTSVDCAHPNLCRWVQVFEQHSVSGWYEPSRV